MTVIRSSRMRFRTARRAMTAVLVALLVFGLAGPASSVTEEDIERAREEAEQARTEVEEAQAGRDAAAAARAAAIDDLDQAVVEYEAINAEFQELTFRMGRLRSRLESYEAQVVRLRDEIRVQAVEAYMTGPDRDPMSLLFASDSVQYAFIAREILAAAVAGDVASLDSLLAATAEMNRLRDQLATDGLRASQLRADAEAVAGKMNALFEDADLEYAQEEQQLGVAEAELASEERDVRSLEEQRAAELRAAEEARRRREAQRAAIAAALATPAGQGVGPEVTPGFICPVGGASRFVDSWGAPRSGGRTHKGVDMMAARGTPLVAVGDGYITISYGTLGGNIVWLHADHGVSYFYAHLDSYPQGLVHGQRVVRGQPIGYVGDTGNPAPGAYHLHFGIYPGGSTAVNPYPSVARVC